MSTNDVPGHNPINKDELAMGCWAEHEDGSLLLVQSSESGRIIYTVFDLDADPPLQYNDTMAEKAFMKTYSWDKKKSKKDKWVWHDKSPFPWNLVMDSDIQQGPGYTSADDLQSAAARVAESRKLKGKVIDDDDTEQMAARFGDLSLSDIRQKVGSIVTDIQKALDKHLR